MVLQFFFLNDTFIFARRPTSWMDFPLSFKNKPTDQWYVLKRFSVWIYQQTNQPSYHSLQFIKLMFGFFEITRRITIAFTKYWKNMLNEYLIFEVLAHEPIPFSAYFVTLSISKILLYSWIWCNSKKIYICTLLKPIAILKTIFLPFYRYY